MTILLTPNPACPLSQAGRGKGKLAPEKRTASHLLPFESQMTVTACSVHSSRELHFNLKPQDVRLTSVSGLGHSTLVTLYGALLSVPETQPVEKGLLSSVKQETTGPNGVTVLSPCQQTET